MKTAKRISGLIFAGLIALSALIAGCENDLKDIQKISASEVSKPIERYTAVDVIYSDSAKVKAHMTSPLMLQYTGKEKYTEMPKGVKVIFYNKDLKESSSLVADYGMRLDSEKTIKLRKNVVATNINGDVFSSDELIWDENAKQIHSDKLVHVKMADGSITDGTSFTSDEDFNKWKLDNGRGKINVNSQDSPQ
ncbi:MAG: LPS export ABC transporter periplasmic protein LptC [Mucilaginibacter sp.]